jgi:hypothetical protein
MFCSIQKSLRIWTLRLALSSPDARFRSKRGGVLVNQVWCRQQQHSQQARWQPTELVDNDVWDDGNGVKDGRERDRRHQGLPGCPRCRGRYRLCTTAEDSFDCSEDPQWRGQGHGHGTEEAAVDRKPAPSLSASFGSIFNSSKDPSGRYIGITREKVVPGYVLWRWCSAEVVVSTRGGGGRRMPSVVADKGKREGRRRWTAWDWERRRWTC